MSYEAIRGISGMTDAEVATANRLLKQLEDKRPRNELRASVYDGKRAATQISAVLPKMYSHLGMVLGWVPKGVDALGRRCTLERFTWADGDLAGIGGDEVFDENFLRTEVSSAITSSLIHSLSFLVTVAGEDGEPDALILARDALNATGDWNRRRRGMDNLISVTGREENRVTSFTLYLDGLTLNAEKRNGSWSAEGSSHPWGVPVEALPYRPRLGRPFGSSRISRPAMAAQDAGLRELLRLEGHMDVYSFPELLLLGADGSVFKDENGNTLPSWMSMVGRVKGIPDDEDAANPRASAVQIPASSPEPHLAALNAQAKLCAREMSLPDSSLALTDTANPTSAEAYDSSQYELIAEAEGSIDDWSTPLRRAYARALAIKNGESRVPDAYRSINAKFRNPRYLTRSAEADAGTKQLSAVPWLAETEVGLELLGLTEDQIRRAVSDRRRSQGLEILSRLRDGSTTQESDVDAGSPAS